jgi:Glucosamine 6-phosphate synthetase, contains amidotransferase and phosphosugar isomerase domains
MCVAILKPAGKYLDPDDLCLAHQANSDGCGFTVRCPQGLLTRKGLWSFAEFWRQFEPYQHLDALVHFRWASMGVVTAENCHPFAVFKELALIHNGHFGGYGGKEKSDTREWMELVLRPLLKHDPTALDTPVVRRLLEASIGRSKVALLGTAKTYILGGDKEDWEDEIWYSQREYRYPRAHLGYQDVRSTTLDYADDEALWGEERACECCGTAPATMHFCTACLTGEAVEEDE